MRKLEKFLKKLTPKEREAVVLLLEGIISRQWEQLDLKRLTGHKDVYRVRKGNTRIIFLDEGGEIRILSIGRKNERTYRDY